MQLAADAANAAAGLAGTQVATDAGAAASASASQASQSLASAEASVDVARGQFGLPHLYVGASGDWWGAAHWAALAHAIGYSDNYGGTFGRSPWDESTGSYDPAAQHFQNWLNANDGGRTSDVSADGYWGPTTTEKLRARLYYVCGFFELPSAIDGVDRTGHTWNFNQDEASALAQCLNTGQFAGVVTPPRADSESGAADAAFAASVQQSAAHNAAAAADASAAAAAQADSQASAATTLAGGRAPRAPRSPRRPLRRLPLTTRATLPRPLANPLRRRSNTRSTLAPRRRRQRPTRRATPISRRLTTPTALRALQTPRRSRRRKHRGPRPSCRRKEMRRQRRVRPRLRQPPLPMQQRRWP